MTHQVYGISFKRGEMKHCIW